MKHIGLFVDVDNAQLAAADLALAHCRTSALWVGALVAELERACDGVVSVRRAYGDALMNAARAMRDTWKIKDFREQITSDLDLQLDLANNGFQMIHCPTVSHKNRADILMALDCMELASSAPHIEAFAILSQDSDFSPLFHRLRALGKAVILVTVGKPSGHSWRMLEALASQWVVYDQHVIDRAGFEAFKIVVEHFKESDPQSLEKGIALSALHARIVQHDAAFAYETIGFSRFTDFVDACVDPPLVRKGNDLRLMTQPAARLGAGVANVRGSAVAPSGAAPDAPMANVSGPVAPRPSGAAPLTRDQVLTAALNRQQLRPLPELRREIGRWLRDEIFSQSGKALAPLTYGELVDQVEARFIRDSFSKSQIGDAMRILSMSSVITLDREVGCSVRTWKVSHMNSPDESRADIVSFLVQRLEDAGEILSESDIGPLARIMFGATDEELLTATREGIELAKKMATEQ